VRARADAVNARSRPQGRICVCACARECIVSYDDDSAALARSLYPSTVCSTRAASAKGEASFLSRETDIRQRRLAIRKILAEAFANDSRKTCRFEELGLARELAALIVKL